MQQLSGPLRGSSGLVGDYQLRHHYRRIYPDVYVHRDVEVDPEVRAQAVWCWSGGRGHLAGWSAAAMHGVRFIDSDADGALNLAGHRRAPRGMAIYRDTLAPDDRMLRRSFDVTSPARTAFDLARRLDIETAVEAVDAIYQATGLTPDQLARYADRHTGARNISLVREVTALSDTGAESRWETRTRLVILAAGLPKPASQVEIRGDDGRFIARVDLCWTRWKVIVEYDGDHHFDKRQRNRDIERWNALEAAGWRVIRVKARQLSYGRELLVDQIRRLLTEAGALV